MGGLFNSANLMRPLFHFLLVQNYCSTDMACVIIFPIIISSHFVYFSTLGNIIRASTLCFGCSELVSFFVFVIHYVGC